MSLPSALPASPAPAGGQHPRTANIYSRNYYEPGDTQLLARWDVLVLDPDTPLPILQEIRAYNPDIKLLVFFPINGTYTSATKLPDGSAWREAYEMAQTQNWWLRDTHGGIIQDHGTKYTFNTTQFCPRSSRGESILDWFPRFAVQIVSRPGPETWDGIFLDDVWVGINWVTIDTTLNPYPIDADHNGIADTPQELDGWWKAANDTLTARIRRALPADKILVGNGQNHFYQLNGAMIETFPFNGFPDPGNPFGFAWTQEMFGQYGYFNNEDHYNNRPERLNIINVKWRDGDRYAADSSPVFEQEKRFTLVSCMLRDGYYSLDWDNAYVHDGGQHKSLWWEPEYDLPIGTPTGSPYQVSAGGVTIWRRDFTNGSVVLNPNLIMYPGSYPDSIPPLAPVDARIILNGQFYHPDVTPPARITDLHFTQVWPDSVEVEWTNTGDDGLAGQAASVGLRYATFPITDANFLQASRAGAPMIAGNSGTLQRGRVTGLAAGQQYYFVVRAYDSDGNGSLVSPNLGLVAGGGVSSTGEGAMPGRFALSAPAPNPSRGAVQFTLASPAAESRAALGVFDSQGRRVRALFDGPVPAGYERMSWDGRDDAGRPVATGVYFLSLRGAHGTQTQKVIRVK